MDALLLNVWLTGTAMLVVCGVLVVLLTEYDVRKYGRDEDRRVSRNSARLALLAPLWPLGLAVLVGWAVVLVIRRAR